MVYSTPKPNENYWHHILPFTGNRFENIRKGDYILEFRKSEFENYNPKTMNRAFYSCKIVNKVFVSAIYNVFDITNESIGLENIITPDNKIIFGKDRLEDGQFYVSNFNEIESLLPYDWESAKQPSS